MAWLSRREYATGEMRDKLIRAEFVPEIVQLTMDWLLDNDLLSNQRFSRSFCRRRAGQGYGPQRVRLEMRQRGVPAVLVDSALSRVNWLDAAQYAYQKRFKSQPAENPKERVRQQKYLAQRGFSHDIIQQIL